MAVCLGSLPGACPAPAHECVDCPWASGSTRTRDTLGEHSAPAPGESFLKYTRCYYKQTH